MLTSSNNFVWIWKMRVDETGEVHQTIEDIPRINCFKIPRTTYCAIQVLQIWRSMPCNENRNPPQVFSMEFCEILEQLLSRIFFWRVAEGYFWRESRVGEGRAVMLLVSGFDFFQGRFFSFLHYFLLYGKGVFSLKLTLQWDDIIY